ncbi:MAG: 16S rRNA processing protein RimM [Candidatus Electronema aureum]|uniref:Ribosome maturation factor RimM n=1 Tax=Candidatus Electronema aureum TaxID=2005002 RepID=A0A521G4G1_9BACT|nr:MAG: 16S rRNA processing protein RimM [Candidatus Electronema aureum]
MTNSAEELVLIGRVSGAHGLKGELKMRPYSGEPESLLSYSRLLLALGEPESTPILHKIERSRAHKSWAVVKLEDCNSRTEAEKLLFASIYVYEDDLPELDEGEFYLRELEGRFVKTEEGQVIGKIIGLLSGGAQDILQIDNNGKEYLIPLVPEFIVEIEEDAVIMSLPLGLLEINA